MKYISLIWGSLSIILMLITFSLNAAKDISHISSGVLLIIFYAKWLYIPVSGVGIIVSGIALGTMEKDAKDNNTLGLICCVIPVMVGILAISVGIF